MVVYRRALTGPPAEDEQLRVVVDVNAVARVGALLEADVGTHFIASRFRLPHPGVHVRERRSAF